jgi:hypothetical protein
MTAGLAVNALIHACTLRRPAGTIVHSDRGSQFRSHTFTRALHEQGLRGSMGRVGACADNAAMESFFSPLQKNGPQPPTLANPRATPIGDYHLDRKDLPPPTTPRPPRAASHPSNTRHSCKPPTRPDHPYPNESTKPGAEPSIIYAPPLPQRAPNVTTNIVRLVISRQSNKEREVRLREGSAPSISDI